MSKFTDVLDRLVFGAPLEEVKPLAEVETAPEIDIEQHADEIAEAAKLAHEQSRQFTNVQIAQPQLGRTTLQSTNDTGMPLNRKDSGLTYWAIHAVYRLYMQQISTCPPVVTDPNGNEVDQVWLRKPNRHQSHRELLASFVYYLTHYGNGFLTHDTFSNGVPRDVSLYYPPDVSYLYINRNGLRSPHRPIHYYYGGRRIDIDHIRFMDVGYAYGVGMFHAIAPQQKIAEAAQDYAYRKYIQSITTQLLYKSNRSLTEAEQQRARLQFAQNFYGARNAYSIQFLEEGESIEHINVTGPDMSLLEHERITAAQIAAIAQIDQQYLNVIIKGDNETYSNILDKRHDLYDNALSPVISIIEESFTRILPRGYTYALDTARLRPVSTAQREAAKNMGEINKIYADMAGENETPDLPFTKDEIRERMGLPKEIS